MVAELGPDERKEPGRRVGSGEGTGLGTAEEAAVGRRVGPEDSTAVGVNVVSGEGGHKEVVCGEDVQEGDLYVKLEKQMFAMN